MGDQNQDIFVFDDNFILNQNYQFKHQNLEEMIIYIRITNAESHEIQQSLNNLHR